MAKKNQVKRDVYKEVTEKIITALEQGTVPWVRPWACLGDGRPMNPHTGKRATGINVLLLTLGRSLNGYQQDRWLTFRQAKAAGGSVRKGERGTTAVRYNNLKLKERDDEGKPVLDADGQEKVVVIPQPVLYTLFNVEQIDGLPDSYLGPAPKEADWTEHALAEQILSGSGAEIHHGGDRAAYSPTGDYIMMPDRAQFADAQSYYATSLHELTHWTGAKHRLDRDLSGRFGSESYAMEELVAELGSAFLYSRCGMQGHLQHAAYIDAWLAVLKRDPRAIFTASGLAGKASDYLLAKAGLADRPDQGNENESRLAA